MQNLALFGNVTHWVAAWQPSYQIFKVISDVAVRGVSGREEGDKLSDVTCN